MADNLFVSEATRFSLFVLGRYQSDILAFKEGDALLDLTKHLVDDYMNFQVVDDRDFDDLEKILNRFYADLEGLLDVEVDDVFKTSVTDRLSLVGAAYLAELIKIRENEE